MLHISTTKRSLGLWASALCLFAACDDSLVTPQSRSGVSHDADVRWDAGGSAQRHHHAEQDTDRGQALAAVWTGQSHPKATLTIEPGTTVCGDATDPQKVSFLNIDQDAKLVADGSREKPSYLRRAASPVNVARATGVAWCFVVAPRSTCHRAMAVRAAVSKATPVRMVPAERCAATTQVVYCVTCGSSLLVGKLHRTTNSTG